MSITNKLKQTSKQAAIAAARQLKNESVEWKESATNQVSGQEKKDSSGKSNSLFFKPSLKGFDVKEQAKQDALASVGTGIAQVKGVEEMNPIAEAMTQKSDTPATTRGADNVEAEMAKYRRMREQQAKEWREHQQRRMQAIDAKKTTQPGEPLLPTSAPKGQAGPGNKASKIEMGRGKKH